MKGKSSIIHQKEIVFNVFGQIKYRKQFYLKKQNRYYRQIVNEGL